MEETQEESGPAITKCCNNMNNFRSCVVQNIFMVSSLLSVALGILFGLIAKACFTLSELEEFYIGFPGEVLINLLKLVTVPLIVTGVITGVSALSVGTSRKIAMRAAVYFVSTTFVSVTIGLILVLLMKPGAAYSISKSKAEDNQSFATMDALLDLMRNMIPQNLIQACFQQYKTERLEFEGHTVDPNSSVDTNVIEVQLVGYYVDGVNMLGLIVCSFLFGLTLKWMGDGGETLTYFFIILNEMTKSVVNWILCYLPVGVLFMIASHVIKVHEWETAYKLGKFMVVVVIGLIIHAVLVLPTLYLLCVRRNPWGIIKGVSPALLTAVLISSSSAALPITFQCCEEKNKVDCRISRFMLPIGTNINMDGTVLYEVVAVVFIAQLNNINLNISQITTIVLTAAISSTGASGIPATGAVTTLFVLCAVGLPAKEASILVVVEWLLDRCNTVVNVLSDCIGVALVDQMSQKELAQMEEHRNRTRAADGDEGCSGTPGSFEIESFHMPPEV